MILRRSQTWIVLFCLPLLAADRPTFEGDIQPIFRTKCLPCHSGTTGQAGLDLRSPASIVKGGQSGPAAVPGSGAKSLLMDKVSSGSMPPGKSKLTNAEIEKMRIWINDGLPHELGGAAAATVAVTEQDVLPIFQVRCVVCHGKRKQEGGLDLRTIEARLKGGKSGPAVVPGDPEKSLIIQKIVSGDMPPAKLQFQNSVRPPTEAEVRKLKEWIQAGALPAAKRVESASGVAAKDKDFWSFQPPRRPPVPTVQAQSSVRNAIDAFLLQKLEAKGLGYSPEAEKLKLLRRAYVDLIGMPPTPAEVEAYLQDKRPDAYERTIDALLASPSYGERWGRHWLDLAGYYDSESAGAHDPIRAYGWRYRDYVIRAFNSDKPYSQFLIEQIAGDELGDYKAARVDQALIDRLAATGFLRQAPDITNLPELAFIGERANVIADEIEMFTSSVMGLTVGCARCHDHKYDPIPQRDYYRLSAIFQTAFDPYDWIPPKKREIEMGLENEWKETKSFNAPLEAEIQKLEESLKSEEQKDKQAAIRKQITATKNKLKPNPHVRALIDMDGPSSPAYVFRRGDPLNPGEEVEAGTPTVLTSGIEPYRPTPPWPGAPSSGRRLALARWLTQPNHPLTSRVVVNQVWMRHFGRGIVITPSNFGRSGALPSHPELLDWLATEFVNGGWSVKSLHRLIMTSTAYRQSSRMDAKLAAIDPENALLARMPLRRMDAEALYDSVLKATDRLDSKPFGYPEDLEVKPDKEVVAKGSKAGFRRSIYLMQRRNIPVTWHEVFDLPPMTPNCVERRNSTVPTQALQLMNGQTLWEHARYMAGRVIDEAGEDRREQVRRVYLRALSRPPAEAEVASGLSAMDEFAGMWKANLTGERDPAPKVWKAQWMALASFCHSVMNSAEFSYID